MHRSLLSFVLMLGLTAAPSGARAWSSAPHKAVGLLAEDLLSPEAAEKVRDLLGDKVTLGDIAACADDIRGKEGTYCARSFWLEPKPHISGTAAAEAAVAQWETLADPYATWSDRRFALVMLTHLVGDLHQPLQASADDAADPASLAAFLEAGLEGKDVRGWLTGDVIENAALESRAIAKAAGPMAGAMHPLVALRLQMAGVRLAYLINEALAPR